MVCGLHYMQISATGVWRLMRTVEAFLFFRSTSFVGIAKILTHTFQRCCDHQSIFDHTNSVPWSCCWLSEQFSYHVVNLSHSIWVQTNVYQGWMFCSRHPFQCYFQPLPQNHACLSVQHQAPEKANGENTYSNQQPPKCKIWRTPSLPSL